MNKTTTPLIVAIICLVILYIYMAATDKPKQPISGDAGTYVPNHPPANVQVDIPGNYNEITTDIRKPDTMLVYQHNGRIYLDWKRKL